MQEDEVTTEIIPLLASERASSNKHDHRGSVMKHKKLQAIGNIPSTRLSAAQLVVSREEIIEGKNSTCTQKRAMTPP